MNYEVVLTGPFKTQIRRLKKKYPRVAEDIRPLLAQLEAGTLVGDAIPGLEGQVYKVRAASSDMRRGKSGGFRVIYYHAAEEKTIYLLIIYVKVEQENIQVAEIRALLSALEKTSEDRKSVV